MQSSSGDGDGDTDRVSVDDDRDESVNGNEINIDQSESLNQSQPSLPKSEPPQKISSIIYRQLFARTFSPQDDDDDSPKSAKVKRVNSNRCSHRPPGEEDLCPDCQFYTSNYHRIRTQFDSVQGSPLCLCVCLSSDLSTVAKICAECLRQSRST